jgi:hypothetical protein
MLVKLTSIKLPHEPKPPVLGPRLEADVRRRIRELESRYRGAMTKAERGELQKLKDLLRLASKGGDGDAR